jgi:hypothetical protein
MTRSFVPLAPLALFVTAVVGCGNVPDDPGARIFPAAGVIQGTLLYEGPRPCSSNGHIVGNAILLVFDRRNPAPPNGLAVLPANFGTIIGDVLFANEPRYTGTDVYCPYKFGFTENISASAPFAISPFSGGSYMIEGFFDYTGDFLPTFKIRELPEATDIAGGYIDTTDALKSINAGNPNYAGKFLPVEVGIPETGTPDLSVGGPIPIYDMPSSGYVAQNINVTLAQALPFSRPYFYAEGLTQTLVADSQGNADGQINTTVAQESDFAAQSNTGITGTAEGDPDYEPVLTIPQDIQVYAPPSLAQGPANVFESALPHLTLKFGVPNPTTAPPSGAAPNSVSINELPCATGGACAESAAPGTVNPFHFQLNPAATGTIPEGGFFVYQNAIYNPTVAAWQPLDIAEGNGLPMLWPLVILSKLVESTPSSGPGVPNHGEDPASLTAQGSAGQPVVILQGITLLGDTSTTTALPGVQADTIYNTGGANLLNKLFVPPTTGAPPAPVIFQQDHLTVALRPSVICFSHLFDSTPAPDQRGVLVTPFSQGQIATVPPSGSGPIVPPDLLDNANTYATPGGSFPTGDARFQVTPLVKSVQYGCLPKGRYAINVVYPTGQAWTVPNEAGACSGSEGVTDFTGLTCTIKPRPVLYSQGNRAVVEVVGPTNPANCQGTPPAAGAPNVNAVPMGGPAPSVPVDCLVRCDTTACPLATDTCTAVQDPNTQETTQVCIPQ